MIRQYREDDTDALVSVWREANSLAQPFLSEAFVAQVTEDIRNIYLPNVETWVAEDNGNPVGFISVIGDEIGGLFLHPSFHGKGFGSALVDHAAGLHGPLRVEVFEQNAVGRRFYDRYGFLETERYDHAPSGEVIIKMVMSSS